MRRPKSSTASGPTQRTAREARRRPHRLLRGEMGTTTTDRRKHSTDLAWDRKHKQVESVAAAGPLVVRIYCSTHQRKEGAVTTVPAAGALHRHTQTRRGKQAGLS